jgi:hypothetical protein
MTPAERAFRKMQRERELERIRTKAAKTHKEKVQVRCGRDDARQPWPATASYPLGCLRSSRLP